MIGVLLVNMGGPQSPQEMKSFLKRMFLDFCILPYNIIIRTFLSFIISNTRYRKSWKKYILIGGTPIIKSTNRFKELLSERLGKDFLIKTAYSYSKPLINFEIRQMLKEGIKTIRILPMYPHNSISTTKSIEIDVKKATKNTEIEVIFCEEYYKNELFLSFWKDIIKTHIEEQNLNNPLLFFSAHSIPEYHFKKGDKYCESITLSAKLIAQKLNSNYAIGYQSQMKRGKWIGPESFSELKRLSTQNKEVIIVPISFLNENLETIYDIDTVLIPKLIEDTNFKSLTRVKIPDGHPLITDLFENLIL